MENSSEAFNVTEAAAPMDRSALREALDCPYYGNFSMYYVNQVNFWVEGVVQTAVAVPGIIGETEKDFIRRINVSIYFRRDWSIAWVGPSFVSSLANKDNDSQ